MGLCVTTRLRVLTIRSEGPALRVMIADDHPSVRENLRYLLTAVADLRVVGVAKTGTEALEMVRESRPDVLVLDADLPDLDGVEVARALHREGVSTRVILYTLESEVERYSGRWNIAACVPKDARPSDLIDAIRESVRADRGAAQHDTGQSD